MVRARVPLPVPVTLLCIALLATLSAISFTLWQESAHASTAAVADKLMISIVHQIRADANCFLGGISTALLEMEPVFEADPWDGRLAAIPVSWRRAFITWMRVRRDFSAVYVVTGDAPGASALPGGGDIITMDYRGEENGFMWGLATNDMWEYSAARDDASGGAWCAARALSADGAALNSRRCAYGSGDCSGACPFQRAAPAAGGGVEGRDGDPAGWDPETDPSMDGSEGRKRAYPSACPFNNASVHGDPRCCPFDDGVCPRSPAQGCCPLGNNRWGYMPVASAGDNSLIPRCAPNCAPAGRVYDVFRTLSGAERPVHREGWDAHANQIKQGGHYNATIRPWFLEIKNDIGILAWGSIFYSTLGQLVLPLVLPAYYECDWRVEDCKGRPVRAMYPIETGLAHFDRLAVDMAAELSPSSIVMICETAPPGYFIASSVPGQSTALVRDEQDWEQHTTKRVATLGDGGNPAPTDARLLGLGNMLCSAFGGGEDCWSRVVSGWQSTDDVAGSRYIAKVLRYNDTKVPGIDWNILLGVPYGDIYGKLEKEKEVQLTLTICMTAAAVMVISIVVYTALRPLRTIRDNMHVAHGMRLDEIMAKDNDSSCISEVSAMQKDFRSLIHTLVEYRRYLPQSIINAGEELAEERISVPEVEAPTGGVAFVFTDILNSTLLWETVPDGMDFALEEHNKIMRGCCRQYQGYEVKTIGDAFFIAFQDPVNALQFCMHAQEQLLAAPTPVEFEALELTKRVIDEATGKQVWGGLRVRMGCHFGTASAEVNQLTKRTDYRGQAINKASRCESTGIPGVIVCSEEFHAAILPRKAELYGGQIHIVLIGLVEMKGIPGPQRVFAALPPSLKARPVSKTTDHLSLFTTSGATRQILESLSGRSTTTARTINIIHQDAKGKLGIGVSLYEATVCTVHTHISAGSERLEHARLQSEYTRLISACMETGRRVRCTVLGVNAVHIHVGWNLGGAHAVEHAAQGLRFGHITSERLGQSLASFGLATGLVLFGNMGASTEQRFPMALGLPFYLAAPLAASARGRSVPILAAATDPRRAPIVFRKYCSLVDVWGAPGGRVEVLEPLSEGLAKLDQDDRWGNDFTLTSEDIIDGDCAEQRPDSLPAGAQYRIPVPGLPQGWEHWSPANVVGSLPEPGSPGTAHFSASARVHAHSLSAAASARLTLRPPQEDFTRSGYSRSGYSTQGESDDTSLPRPLTQVPADMLSADARNAVMGQALPPVSAGSALTAGSPSMGSPTSARRSDAGLIPASPATPASAGDGLRPGAPARGNPFSPSSRRLVDAAGRPVDAKPAWGVGDVP